jgi:coenzyme PQQ synthesis protein D (PqqD)
MSADIPERSTSMAWQVIDGEMVLLDIDGRELLGLNEVGARVWELADGTRTVAEIIAAVEREFDVGIDEAAADVRRFVDELASCGAVTFRRG